MLAEYFLQNARWLVFPEFLYGKSIHFEPKIQNFPTIILQKITISNLGCKKKISENILFLYFIMLMSLTNRERLADKFNIIFSDWEGEDTNYIHGKYLEHHPRTIKFRSMEVEQGSPFKLPRLKTAHSKTR